MNSSYQRALILHAQGRYADAERELRQSLAGEPNDPGAHAMLALCLAHGEDYKGATAEAQAAIGLAPGLPFCHYVLAHVMRKRNRLDEALAAIDEAIAIEPDNADYFALLAGVRLDQRNWPSALEAAETGLSHDPTHVQCSNLRAMALVKLGRRDEAGMTIDAALRRSPEDADSHANQGWTLLHAGEPRRAMEHFREALRLDPNHQWARAGIVEALKARVFLYRWLLAYFLWMARLSGRAQWGILLGGYFGYRYLTMLADQNPALGKYLRPVLIAYITFAILTWLSYPMFNLMLRLSRFGRLALSRKQTIESNCIGLLLAGAIVAALVRWRTGSDGYEVLAVVLGLMIMPTAVIFRASAGWPLVVAIVAASLLAAVGLFTAAIAFALSRLDQQLAKQLLSVARTAFSAFTWGVLIVAIGSNWLADVKPRR